VVFDQNAKKPLDRAIKSSVNHDGAGAASLFVGIFQVESLRQGHIELNGATLPRSTDGISDMEIDFWPIKRPLSFAHLEWLAASLQCAQQTACSVLPLLIVANGIFFWTCRQYEMVDKTISCINFLDKLKDAQDFIFDLVRFHKDVGIVLVEATHPH